MALTDDERQTLRTSLADHLDEDTATLVLEALPPMDFDDLATKGDLSRVETDIGVLKTDMAEVKSGVAANRASIVASEGTLRQELALGLIAVGTRIDEQGARLDGRIDSLGTSLNTRLDGLNTRLDSFGREQRQLVFGAVGVMLGAMVALAAFIVSFG